MKVAIKDMELEKFKRIVAKLTGVENIILTGWGEPFIHQDIIEMIKFCKGRGFKVRLTSNGSLLSDKLITELIASKLDAITFSLDEIKPSAENLGHLVGAQLNNIKKLAAKREETGSGIKIYLQTVCHKGKEQNIYDIIEFALKYNLDRVRLTRLDIRFNDFKRLNIKEEKKLIKNIERMIKGRKIGVDFLPYVALDGIVRTFYKFLYPLLHRLGKYCLRTYSDVYINVNGQATPCCALPLLALGDMEKESLSAIWNSQKFRDFRKNQLKICGRCDILSVKPYNR